MRWIAASLRCIRRAGKATRSAIRFLRRQRNIRGDSTTRFLSAVDHIQLDRLRRHVMQQMDDLFRRVDVLLAPAVNGPMTVIGNMTGHPCLTIRTGFSESRTRDMPAFLRGSEGIGWSDAFRAARHHHHGAAVRRGGSAHARPRAGDGIDRRRPAARPAVTMFPRSRASQDNPR